MNSKTVSQADAEPRRGNAGLLRYIHLAVPLGVIIVAAVLNWISMQHMENMRHDRHEQLRTLSQHVLTSVTGGGTEARSAATLQHDLLASLVLRPDVTCAILDTGSTGNFIAGDEATCQGLAAMDARHVRVADSGNSLVLFYDTTDLDQQFMIFLRITLVALLCGLSLAILFNGLSHRLFIRHEIDMRRRAEIEARKAHAAAERAARKAEAASGAKGAFLTTMSHEIRTTLNGIIGISGVLSNELEDDTRRGYAQMISSSGKSLLHMLNDTLDLSKIEAGCFKLQAEEFALPHMLREAVSLFQPRAGEKQLHLDLTIDDSLPTCVKADPVRLRQVLSNLVSNAVKFTDAGCVAVHASARPSAGKPGFHDIVMKVSDTGTGIAEADLGTIFEHFGQTCENKRQREGSGLGLAISRELMRLMGGDLTAESRQGEGSTFTITLRAEGCFRQIITHDPADCAAASDQQGIILVSPDKQLARNMDNRLSSRGYTVNCFGSFEAAQTAFSGDSCQFLVVDLDSDAANLAASLAGLRDHPVRTIGLSRAPASLPAELARVADVLLLTPGDWSPMLEHLAHASLEGGGHVEDAA
ncbi:MAG: HAMP domain-containing sensor histidine kinase [Anderseniella sp.]|nr:HAMP domain-containing sensor histidine kinase [Anderseniella sp.]